MKKIQLSPIGRQLAQWLGIGAFYLLSLFVFLRLTFPYDTLKQRVLSEFNQSQTDKRLEIDDMSGYWLFGIEADGVRLISLDRTVVAAGETAPPPDVLAIDNVSASVSLLSYLFGTLNVSFGAELGGGEMDGTFKQSDTDSYLEMTGESVDISGLTLLSKGIGLPLGGKLSGQLDLHLPEKKAQKAEGKMELAIVDLSVGDGKAKVRNTIALPKLSAGDLSLKAEVAAGRMDISEFASNGGDFQLSADGKVRLREPFERSVADLNVSFKFKDAYTSKSDLTKSIFGSPDGKIPGLFDMDPQVRQAKGDDGFYRWRVTGLLTHPSFRPGNKINAQPAASAAEPSDDE